ncbi:uncharacterized [Tachysurus ichikawai]
MVHETRLNEALVYMAPPLYAHISKPAAVSAGERSEGGAAFEAAQEMSIPPSLFFLSPLFSQRAGSIRRDSSPSLKGLVYRLMPGKIRLRQVRLMGEVPSLLIEPESYGRSNLSLAGIRQMALKAKVSFQHSRGRPETGNGFRHK